MRGRPRISPRLLLDAILWKLTTAHTWEFLPSGFPPGRTCQNYYRRLRRSGRWYTLMLALYNHFRQEANLDLPGVVRKGLFVTTPHQKIALRKQVPLTWRTCTALLFMQLARSGWSYLHRIHDQHPPNATHQPVFRGTSPLTTGLLPDPAMQKPPREPLSPSASSDE